MRRARAAASPPSLARATRAHLGAAAARLQRKVGVGHGLCERCSALWRVASRPLRVMCVSSLRGRESEECSRPLSPLALRWLAHSLSQKGARGAAPHTLRRHARTHKHTQQRDANPRPPHRLRPGRDAAAGQGRAGRVRGVDGVSFFLSVRARPKESTTCSARPHPSPLTHTFPPPTHTAHLLAPSLAPWPHWWRRWASRRPRRAAARRPTKRMPARPMRPAPAPRRRGLRLLPLRMWLLVEAAGRSAQRRRCLPARRLAPRPHPLLPTRPHAPRFS